MSKKTRTPHLNTRALVKGLSDMVGALPTESQKEEARASFEKLIHFLNDVRDSLDLIPSSEDMSQTARVLDKLNELFVRAEADPILAASLGLRLPAKVRQGRDVGSASELGKARITLQELEALPVDEIRRRLEGESTPLTELRAVASLLGIRPVKKLSRDALSHQIAMKIANYRGYQQLRIGTDADAAHLQTTRAEE